MAVPRQTEDRSQPEKEGVSKRIGQRQPPSRSASPPVATGRNKELLSFTQGDKATGRALRRDRRGPASGPRWQWLHRRRPAKAGRFGMVRASGQRLTRENRPVDPRTKASERRGVCHATFASMSGPGDAITVILAGTGLAGPGAGRPHAMPDTGAVRACYRPLGTTLTLEMPSPERLHLS